ncbi:PqiC family protein [Prosthecobacter sp.]|uniref:PqiC family protein n=1 Tax=Prosthecobacter sp. TaxID=1965333 RepID=UPI002488CBEE|nr:PqiC family protein [Prosthecobacter sp.]MDI1312072.1 PqiC family protein [Prosthecobacter sp.]
MNLRLLTFALLLTLTGCSVLQPVKDSTVRHLLEPLVPDRALTAARPAMAVNRASLPGYLDTQQLVTRSEGKLMVSNRDVWGEPLDTGISRVIARNLSRITGSMNIQPVESFTSLDYGTLLELRITQFEPNTDNQMVLEGTWKLQPVTGGETRSHYFRLLAPVPVDPSAMTARVTAMNQALEQLSRQIARGQ